MEMVLTVLVRKIPSLYYLMLAIPPPPLPLTLGTRTGFPTKLNEEMGRECVGGGGGGGQKKGGGTYLIIVAGLNY
jgi:hypothetical protein